VTDDERIYLDSVQRWVGDEGAYQHQQQTRPLTLAPALSDSPPDFSRGSSRSTGPGATATMCSLPASATTSF
jgi:hypothetical protein